MSGIQKIKFYLLIALCLKQVDGFSQACHVSKLPSRRQVMMMQFNMNKGNESKQETESSGFKPNKPIDLPSLNLQDAGPMYATCRSVTGVENESSYEEETGKTANDVENFTPNKPIELDSLQQPTFFGLEPKEDSLRQRDGSMENIGLPMFTSTIIMMMSVYFIYVALFGEDVLIDPSVPLLI